jgi:cell division protein FtsI (penicillin-binding protein 3)
MAGSVFGKIAERVYAKDLRFDIRNAIDSTTNVIPAVKGGEMNEALYVLNELNVPVQKQFSGQKRKELWGHTQAAPEAVILQDQVVSSATVPNVIGMGAKDAVYLLESKGLKVRISGVGRVKSQSIPSGNRIVKGQTILLTMRH